MINILIEIDGYNQQVLLTGQSCSLKQLRQKYKQAKKHASSSTEIPKVMCALYQFRQISYEAEVKVTFVIDTDTDRIYAPTY